MFTNVFFEKDLLKKGHTLIAGVDEVGRGPIAGPMVVSAVILDISNILKLIDCYDNLKPNELDKKYSNKNINESKYPKNNNKTNYDILNHTNNDIEQVKKYSKIKDSKKTTKNSRKSLDEFIKKVCLSFSIIEISSSDIDKMGISKATNFGFYESIKKLAIKPSHIITDAFKIKNFSQKIQTNLIKGDTLSISVASASILAKVYRDTLMEKLSLKYSEYDFYLHKGYCTKKHLQLLQQYGPCEIHRKSFEPVKSITLKK